MRAAIESLLVNVVLLAALRGRFWGLCCRTVAVRLGVLSAVSFNIVRVCVRA